MGEELSLDLGQSILRQAFDLWINPEIEDRHKKGKVDSAIDVVAAQIIFNSDLPVSIRLNGEVKAHAQIKVNRAISIGEPVTLADVDAVVSVELTDEDPNAAHITIVRNGSESWAVTFSFQYNRARASGLMSAAGEYIQMATYAQENGFWRAFVDNLYSAVELAAKARLFLISYPKIMTSNSHSFVVTHFNVFGGKMGNAPAPQIELLNDLNRTRSVAKYGPGPFAIEVSKAIQMLRIGQEMIAAVGTAIKPPRR